MNRFREVFFLSGCTLAAAAVAATAAAVAAVAAAGWGRSLGIRVAACGAPQGSAVRLCCYKPKNLPLLLLRAPRGENDEWPVAVMDPQGAPIPKEHTVGPSSSCYYSAAAAVALAAVVAVAAAAAAGVAIAAVAVVAVAVAAVAAAAAAVIVHVLYSKVSPYSACCG